MTNKKTFLTTVLSCFLLGATFSLTAQGAFFGEPFVTENAVAFESMLEKAQGQDSLVVTVQASVTEVCQMKGCWMNIQGKDTAESMMVRFKDYGFFMPKDIADRQVIAHGYVFRETVSVDDLRHYAEDAGKSKEEIEAITEPEEKWSFLASGVYLLDEK